MQIVTGIKYCGGCNPHIDRTKLALEIEKLLPSEYSLTTDHTFNPWNIGILICGCPTSCADKPDVRGLARKCIVMAEGTEDWSSIFFAH
jgi:4-hydroxybutyrate CoA-transferase